MLARLLAGFIVAVACTPAGVSGAVLLLPLQIQVFNVPSPTVSATNLVFNMVSAPAGVATFGRSGRLDFYLAGILCAGTVPGVIVGALIRSTWLAEPDRFGWIAAVVLAAMGLRLLISEMEDSGSSIIIGGRFPPVWRLALVGTVAGIVGGIYGLGGAALVVPWLVAVERIPFDRVAGATLLTTVVTSVVGLATFVIAAGSGFGDATAPRWADGLALGVGGVFGAIVGARLQPRIPIRLLRVVLALVAIVAAVRLLP